MRNGYRGERHHDVPQKLRVARSQPVEDDPGDYLQIKQAYVSSCKDLGKLVKLPTAEHANEQINNRGGRRD